MECPTVLWDHGMGWTVGHTRICRGTGEHPMESPTVPWDYGMRWTIPLSHGTMGWDGQWDTHASVEGQVDIPWNVPLSHGTVGWDGQFTAFLDIYVPALIANSTKSRSSSVQSWLEGSLDYYVIPYSILFILIRTLLRMVTGGKHIFVNTES